MTITSLAWWKAALIRALRTAIAIALPYLGGSLLVGIPYITIASAAGLGVVLSLITSLAGIPEAVGAPVRWWQALGFRAVKTFAQALVAGIGSAILFQDVHWTVVLQTSLIATAVTLLGAALTTLPEAPTVDPTGRLTYLNTRRKAASDKIAA